MPVGSWPSNLSFSPDGTRAYVISDRSELGSTVTVIDRSDGTSSTFQASPYASDIRFSPDGRFGYSTGADEVTFIDLADNATSFVPVPAPNNVRFSADGRYAYIINALEGTAMVVALDDIGGADDPQTQV